MAKPTTQQRITRDGLRSFYMNRVFLTLTFTSCFCIAYQLITDSVNVFAPSSVLSPGKWKIKLNYNIHFKSYATMFQVLTRFFVGYCRP